MTQSYQTTPPILLGEEKYELAPYGFRLIAYSIDSVLCLGFTVLLSNAILSIFFHHTWNEAEVFVPFFILNGFFSWLFFFFQEALTKGKTIGKSLLGLRTVDEITFQKASRTQYFLNNLLRGLDWLDVLLGGAMQGEKKQLRWLQHISRTAVIMPYHKS